MRLKSCHMSPARLDWLLFTTSTGCFVTQTKPLSDWLQPSGFRSYQVKSWHSTGHVGVSLTSNSSTRCQHLLSESLLVKRMMLPTIPLSSRFSLDTKRYFSNLYTSIIPSLDRSSWQHCIRQIWGTENSQFKLRVTAEFV